MNKNRKPAKKTKKTEKSGKNKLNLHFRRFEFKYPMHISVLEKVIPIISDFMEPDPYANKDGYYHVHSLYYDSPKFKTYVEKLAGIRFRKKYRVRSYHLDKFDPSSQVYWEIKRKKDAIVLKDKIPFVFKDFESDDWDLLKTGSVKEDDVVDELKYDFMQFRLEPKVVIQYKRKPFMYIHDPSFRLTFDYEISAKKTDQLVFDNEYEYPIMSDYGIIEAKFYGSLPIWFGKIIKQFSLVRRAFSKYEYSVRKVHDLWY